MIGDTFLSITLTPLALASISKIWTSSPRFAFNNADLALLSSLLPFTSIVGCPGTLNLKPVTFNGNSKSKSSNFAPTVEI